MPIEGSRIPVKLPWKGATDNSAQFSSIKSPVAKFLGFDRAKDSDLEYETKAFKKNKGDEKGGGAKVTVKRRRRPGYRQRSIKLTFQTGRPAGAGRKSTLTGKKIKVGNSGETYASIQFPITKSVAINDVIKYFETGAGKSLKDDCRTPNGYRVGSDLLRYVNRLH